MKASYLHTFSQLMPLLTFILIIYKSKKAHWRKLMLIVALNFLSRPAHCSAAVLQWLHPVDTRNMMEWASVSSLSWHEICARYITKSYISTGSQQWTERNLKSVTISRLDGDLFCNSTIFRLIQKKVESYLIFLIHVREHPSMTPSRGASH